MNFTNLKYTYETIKKFAIQKIFLLAKEEIESKEKKKQLDDFFISTLEKFKGQGFWLDMLIIFLIKNAPKITQSLYNKVASEIGI